MAIKETEKIYIECRIFVLGEKSVGKKSFIGRMLNLPSTSVIRNYEAEKEFNKRLEELAKKIEEEEDFMRQSKEEKYRRRKNKNESATSGNTSSRAKRTGTESKDITVTKGKEKERLDTKKSETKKIINIGYKINFLPSKIAKSKIYHRPPMPEFPSKLFNIFKTKMIFKPYFISPAEDLSYDSNPKDDEDSDYEFEKEYKLTVKGIKRDINKVMNIKNTIVELDKLSGYKIYIYYIFLFLYDMTDYSSFETLIKYFDRLETKYDITNDGNLIPCIIGTKKDRNILFDEEQSRTLNEFINKYNLKHYEISTKPFFNFGKFYTQLIIDNLGPMHPEFEENNFKDELKKLIESKSNFSKASRTPLTTNEKNPGPEYDLNIYSFNSMKELREALMNKKTRFNRKIFANKQGPIIYGSKSSKDIENSDNKEKKKNLIYISNGGIINKPIVGFTFGITEGRLNLVKSRRDLNRERNKNLTESIEGDFTFNLMTSTVNTKPDSYFEEASARKSLLLNQRILERQKKMEKIEIIHKNNLEKIAAEKEAKKNIIIPKLHRSSSAPDLEVMNENKQRYYEVVYGKNKDYLDRFYKRRFEIEKEKIREEKERIKLMEKEREKQKELELEKEKEKKKEIERKEKFRIKMKSSRISLETKTMEQKANYPIIKDSFEILLEKNMRRNQTIRDFKPRFEEIKKEKINNPYNDEKIWKKWELNKQIISNKGRLKNFLEKRKIKEKEQKENAKKLEKENEEVKQLRREIIIEKGYEDPFKIKEINYSQVEEAAPKYTIKGRNIPRKKQDNEDTNNFLLGQDKDIIDYIKNIQINRPLPNINYVKPNLPSVVFPKAERFLNYNKIYEGSDDLFKDGIFAPKTQEDFNCKGTFSHDAKRSLEKREKSPSPCDYKIKSSFEIIAEKGNNISENRKRIKQMEENEKGGKKKFIIRKNKSEIGLDKEQNTTNLKD